MGNNNPDGGKPSNNKVDRPSNLIKDGSTTTNPADAGTEIDTPPPVVISVVVNPMSKKLVPGKAQLLGDHLSACTNARMATTDRWCAFSLPGDVLGRAELWVINATKAATAEVKCDRAKPAGPDCVRLHTDLFSGETEVGASYPGSHHFSGDTLLFYADAVSPAGSMVYQGKAYTWKPGWPAPKVISTANAVVCAVHGRADVGVCIENISAAEPLEFDLHAGRITGTAFPKVGHIFPTRAANNASQWGTGFTLTGDYFAYSTGGAGTTPADREMLTVVNLTDGKQTKWPQPLSQWSISADGKKVYYLYNYNYSLMGDPAGTMYVADFPSGLNARQLLPTTTKVGSYDLMEDIDQKFYGVVVRHTVAMNVGKVSILKDPTKPGTGANFLEIIPEARALPAFSSDYRYAFYAVTFSEDLPTFDAFIVKTDGTGRCNLSMSIAASLFGSPFTKSAGLTFLADDYDQGTQSGNGYYYPPDTCMPRMPFGSQVDFWFPYRDDMLVYSDNSTGELVTVRYRPITAGKQLGGATEVQTNAQRMYGILPGFTGILYNIDKSGETTDGLYYYKLPTVAPPL